VTVLGVAVGAIVVLALIVGIAAVTSSSPAAKARMDALRGAPGLELVPPGATVLDRFDSRPGPGGKAEVSIAYGTDADAESVAGYYDERLPGLGYEETRGEQAADESGDMVLREYLRDRTRYSVTLAKLPRKVGNKWTTGPWKHILYVSVRAER
jgi:hypothetical protein